MLAEAVVEFCAATDSGERAVEQSTKTEVINNFSLITTLYLFEMFILATQSLTCQLLRIVASTRRIYCAFGANGANKNRD